MFIEKYARAVNSSDLRDDEHHHATETLAAAALADLTGGSGAVFGSMLARAKAAGVPRKFFESDTSHLAPLVRTWEQAVNEKGSSRGWMPIKHPWDIHAAGAMYNKIARVSLAHWLDGICGTCRGTKVDELKARACKACAGTGRASIEGGRLEQELVRDMISELEGLHQAHCGRAAARLRSAA